LEEWAKVTAAVATKAPLAMGTRTMIVQAHACVKVKMKVKMEATTATSLKRVACLTAKMKSP
jgi:hypothetical protein